MKNLIVQKIIINGNVIQGPLEGINTLADLINIIVLFIYPFAGILLFIYLVWGGYEYLLSGGNPEKVKGAQGKLTSAIIGFILLFVSYVLVQIIVRIFGLNSGVI
ncbi:MAG TPA: hypothetical protein VJB63_03960 [Patescibacteria group bacterium]|nr:hypothetical protein [Patescibacteria group bacterium]